LSPCVQFLDLGNRRPGVVRQQRRDFQRNPTVDAACSVVNRPEQVRGLRKVLHRQFEKQVFSRLAVREFAFDRVIVVFAVPDSVIEDRGVRCEPRHRKLVDVALQRAAVQQLAGDIVEPQALTEIVERPCRFHRVILRLGAKWCRHWPQRQVIVEQVSNALAVTSVIGKPRPSAQPGPAGFISK
jgi:hypothetical protein